MKLQYLDGTEDDDDLFDRPIAEQHTYMATVLGMNPTTPDDWPVDAFDRLLAMRRIKGKPAFYREVGRMLSPVHERMV